MAIDARKALADLAAMPGSMIALPKQQMAELLGELARRQQPPASALTMVSVTTTAGASA